MKSPESDAGGGRHFALSQRLGESPCWASRLSGSLGRLSSLREHGHPETVGCFSPAQSVGRGAKDGWIDPGLGFCRIDSVDGQWDRDEGDIGLMASTLGGEEVRTAWTAGKSGQVRSLQVSGQGGMWRGS